MDKTVICWVKYCKAEYVIYEGRKYMAKYVIC